MMKGNPIKDIKARNGLTVSINSRTVNTKNIDRSYYCKFYMIFKLEELS